MASLAHVPTPALAPLGETKDLGGKVAGCQDSGLCNLQSGVSGQGPTHTHKQLTSIPCSTPGGCLTPLQLLDREMWDPGEHSDSSPSPAPGLPTCHVFAKTPSGTGLGRLVWGGPGAPRLGDGFASSPCRQNWGNSQSHRDYSAAAFCCTSQEILFCINKS